MTVRRSARHVLALTFAVAVLTLAACSSDDDATPPGGHDDPRAAVDAHVEAASAYDIEGDCALLTPERIGELASLDGLEVDTYCATVAAPIEADADDGTRARTRAIYTGATVATIDRPGGTWFSVTSADGTYVEEIETVEVDGRWWIATIESDIDDHDHEDGHDHDHDNEEAPPEGEVGSARGGGTTGSN